MNAHQQPLRFNQPPPTPPALPPWRAALAREVGECRDAVALMFSLLQDLDKRLQELEARLARPGGQGKVA